jgi:putative NIF3 family GTP cyclohydrolase 1 type 2
LISLIHCLVPKETDKELTNFYIVRYASTDTTSIQTIAICAGSGYSILSKCLPKPDLYWTGEMGHHELLSASYTGIHTVLCEHTNTERGYLKAVLQKRLIEDGLQVCVSEQDRDPISIV